MRASQIRDVLAVGELPVDPFAGAHRPLGAAEPQRAAGRAGVACVYDEGGGLGGHDGGAGLEVDGVGSEAVVVGLDRRGVAAHSGAACASETFEPSPVLAAMGSDAEHALRLSVSWATPIEVVDAFGERFVATIEELRQLAT